MKKYILVSVVFISLLFQSCGLGGELLWLDNPTDKAISVEVDGKKYDLAPGELKRVADGKSGKQKFKGADGKEVEIEIDGVSLLNCAKSTYIVASIEYMSNPNSTSSLPTPEEVEVGGEKYTGNFKVYTDIVIPHGNIHFNVSQPIPDEIEVTGSSAVKYKMFRIKDFLADDEMKTYKSE